MDATDDRGRRVEAFRLAFPNEAGRDPEVSPIRGGRRAAEAALADVDPIAYATTRNDLDGAVTRLSPYLRHGVLGMAEVRDAVIARVDRPRRAAKLLAELAWRDYYRRAYRVLGDRVWDDVEPSKAGIGPTRYADELPADLLEGRTGLDCIDAFVRDLYETGYLHNHARMWLASYVVHWRRARWQAGAAWFLTHLLDGDPASNNLSWQWVAGTFASKPYIFNRENLERFTRGAYCRTCPVRGRCDFEGSYESLSARLFGRPDATEPTGGRSSLRSEPDPPPDPRPPLGTPSTVVWVVPDDLSPTGPALSAAPGARAVFVWDEPDLADNPVGLKRLAFLSDCLAELPAEVRRGDASAEVARFAAESGATRVVVTDGPSPRLARVVAGLRRSGLDVDLVRPEPLVRLDRSVDLGRFSRYWKHAEARLLGPPA